MNVERMWNQSTVEGRKALLTRFGLHYKYNALDCQFQELSFIQQLDMLHTAEILL